MERTTNGIPHKQKPLVQDAFPPEAGRETRPETRRETRPETRPEIREDPRGQLVQRIVASPHFVRSPLLSRFLLFVVTETLEGRGGHISEHQIGVQVFDRAADYRTLEDNIVRNYARQLRKRLAEYFASEGAADEWRVDIPVGGYVPAFAHAVEHSAPPAADRVPIALKIRAQAPLAKDAAALEAVRPLRKRKLAIGFAVAGYTAALIGLTWFAAVKSKNAAGAEYKRLGGAATPVIDSENYN